MEKKQIQRVFSKMEKIQVKCSIINKSKYYNSKASQRLYFVLYNFLMKHEKQQQQEKKMNWNNKTRNNDNKLLVWQKKH